MAEKLTKKQKGFADEYLDTGNGTQAVLNSPYNASNENSAAVEAVRTLRKANVQEYIESHAEGASSRVVKLSKEAKNEAVKLSANKDILDRGGFKPVEKTMNLNLDVEITNPKARELAKKYEEELKKSL